MKAVFSNLLALTLVASHVAPVALAAPVATSSQEEKRSLKAVGTAIAGGIASGAAGAIVSDLLNKREPEVEERSLTAIENFFGSLFNKRDELDARSLTAIENFFGSLFNKRDEVDARSLTAIENFFGSLFNKREELDERSVDAITNFLDEHFHIARSEGAELDARSLTAIENFFGSLFNKRDELDSRSLTAIGNFFHSIFGKRDELDARSLTAIGNFFSSLFGKRSEPSGLMVDIETGVIYMDVPDANEGRSLKAIGTAIAGGVASLATGAAINHFIGDKRSESGLMVDTETGIIYMDVPDANEGRSLKAIGTAIAGGVASLATGAVVSDLINKRSEPALYVDSETGTLYLDVPDATEARSLKAVGTAIAGGIASGAAGAVISNLLNRDASGLLVDTETGTIYADVPDAPEARSLKAIGTAVAGGIASGAAGAVISNLLNRDASGLLVDTETGTIYADVPDATEARSLKAVGAAVAGGIASGAAGAVISNLLGRDASGLMVDTETGIIYMDVPDANEGRSLKAIGTAVAGGIASGAAGAIVKDIFDKRDLEVEERSLKAVGAAVAGGVASGAAGAVISNLLGRDASGLMVDTETGVIYMNVPDANEGRSLKAVGTAIAGGIASGAAGAVISNLLNRDVSGLLVDTETGTIYMDVPDAVEGRSLKAVGTAIAGGIASGAAGAIISDILNKRAIDELD
ncbi:unnamed protein product [Peniophora sp. CBMAI 1063]|nr:unnamed protein product [Peniophora sp. CBMAI 1063]